MEILDGLAVGHWMAVKSHGEFTSTLSPFLSRVYSFRANKTDCTVDHPDEWKIIRC